MKKLPRLPRPRALPTKHKRSIIKGSRPASNSSHVSSTSYDHETGQLIIEFTGGRRYRYDDVSPETASGIDKADSIGRYLHAHVIGKHSVTKI